VEMTTFGSEEIYSFSINRYLAIVLKAVQIIATTSQITETGEMRVEIVKWRLRYHSEGNNNARTLIIKITSNT
jgi:hypothetical protein